MRLLMMYEGWHLFACFPIQFASFLTSSRTCDWVRVPEKHTKLNSRTDRRQSQTNIESEFIFRAKLMMGFLSAGHRLRLGLKIKYIIRWLAAPIDVIWLCIEKHLLHDGLFTSKERCSGKFGWLVAKNWEIREYNWGAIRSDTNFGAPSNLPQTFGSELKKLWTLRDHFRCSNWVP